MTAPRVTVLLTSYSRLGYLQDAVNSVLAQTFTDFELVVLDDNSPAASGVPAYLATLTDPRVWVLSSRVPDLERAASTRYAVMLNRGLALARGDLISYLCDDDWYLPGRLAAMVAALDANPGQCVVYGPQLMIEDDGTGTRLIGTRPADRILADPEWQVDHASVMHRAHAGRDAGGWDEHPDGARVGDARFWQRLVRAGHMFYPVLGPPLDVHRYHPGALGGMMASDQVKADRQAGRIV